MARTIKNALQVAQGFGLDRLDTQILLLHALQKPTHDRVWLLSHDTDVITPVQQKNFDALMQRRLAGEPVAYLVGSKAFFGLSLAVNADVLVPRPDTECLVEWALACIPLTPPLSREGRGSCVLDLGTGSGAIGLAIKHNCPHASVTLVDASQAALNVALGNAASLSLAVRGLQSNWFQNIPNDARFDLIVSNPPYIADGDSHLAALAHEPFMALASGADGLDAIRHIVQDAPRYLKRGGWLVLEHGYDQALAVRELLCQQGFLSVESRLDLNGIERCSGGTLKSSFSQA